MTVTTQREECTARVGGRLLMSMDLGRRQWKLGFTTGVGHRPRRRTLSTDAWDRLPEEIAAAKKRFGLPVDAPVISCYEAGRDGFWIHRYLTSLEIENLVVDSSSIEVNRRARRAKTDRLDVEKLLAMLLRYTGGEQTVWRIVRVPTEADEQRRQRHRELFTLKQDRARVTNRIAGLLATVGVLLKVDARFGGRLDRLRQWNGQPVPEALRVRLAREWEKVELLTTQIHNLDRARRAMVRESRDEAVTLVRRLLELRGIGDNAAWVFVTEFFAWRGFRNRRQVGGSTGLVGTPFTSGAVKHEQGISKAGNRRVRAIAVQIAWGWLRHQQQSALTHWYNRRFADGGPVARKIGIVAVARRLVIDLWRYLDAGVMPDGALLKERSTVASGG
jgi:transposase